MATLQINFTWTLSISNVITALAFDKAMASKELS